MSVRRTMFHVCVVMFTLGGNAAAAGFSAVPLHEVPRSIPDISFNDETGQPLSLTSWRGKVVLLNIWATWCVPCREEMPTLDALQARLGSDRFEVVALSIDLAGSNVVRNFYSEIGIQHLGLYIDSSMKTSSSLSVVGLPTTLLINAEGRETGRLIGPAEWDSPKMIKFFKTHLNTN